jgi:DNA-binding winged helix-turn-helix (wHTH) protein
MKKEDLMTALWPDSFVEEVSLASKISLLRKVLEEAGAGAAYNQTVPKQGYRFLAAVTRTWASSPAAATPIQAGEEAPAERPIRFIALPFPIVNGDQRIAFRRG